MRVRLVAGLISALALLMPTAQASGVIEAGPVFPRLVVDKDFPDPDVIEVDGTWYAYSTNNGRGHVPTATAPAPDGPWTTGADAMPGGPSGDWAQSGRTWAPDVQPNQDGTFTLTYTAWHEASGKQCIGVATAASPRGPFVPKAGPPLLCPLERGGAIDANSYVDEDGTRYLLWKNDGNSDPGGVSTLWLSRTAGNGTTLVGDPVGLLSSTKVIEAPDLVKRGDRYFLFFSGGDYGGCGYTTEYATASAPDGPWTRATRSLLTTASVGNHVCGPGGADFVTGLPGGDKVFLHGWNSARNQRFMYVADLGWTEGENIRPVVRGSRSRTEAESGRINNCVIRSGVTSASGGKVVGYIDHADSYVDIEVFAPTAGQYNLFIGYANGSGATATHTLVVNGNNAGWVSYPAGRWDGWAEATANVTLRAGKNSILLGKGTLYAELDSVEIQ